MILTSLTEGVCELARRDDLCTEGSACRSCNHGETEGRGRERERLGERRSEGCRQNEHRYTCIRSIVRPAQFLLRRQRGRQPKGDARRFWDRDSTEPTLDRHTVHTLNITSSSHFKSFYSPCDAAFE